MKVIYENSMNCKMLNRLKTIRGNVVLRSDFKNLGNYRQISRGLKMLITKNLIVRIGHGIYAKAYLSEYIDRPVIKGGFDAASREALTRLGVRWEPGWAEKAYNAGSTQVPVYNIVKLKSRYRGNLWYEKSQIKFEGKINAR